MTLIPEHILKEAIEKGGYPIIGNLDLSDVEYWHHPTILLDPAFWQALSTARVKWRDRDHHQLQAWRLSGGGGELPRGLCTWHSQAKKCYELLLSSPSPEQIDHFWTALPGSS